MQIIQAHSKDHNKHFGTDLIKTNPLDPEILNKTIKKKPT